MLSRKKITAIITLAVLTVAGMAVVLVNSLWQPDPHTQDLMDIIVNNPAMEERTAAYTELMDIVGVVEAQEMLYRSGLPFTGETHLLNHAAGDYVYDKYGSGGLIHCRDYFLSSCYHGAIIATISLEGREELVDVMETCRDVSNTTAAQCAHAIGHGALAWVGYKNLNQAPLFCDDLREADPNFPYLNCLDGVFMENLWAVHDGEPSPDRWMDPEDNFFPCNDPRIAERHLPGCWANQASVVYQNTRGDIAQVSDVCLQVENSEFQEICFDGLARQIHPITNGSANEAFRLCSQVDNRWQNFCLSTIATSDFSVGGRDLAFEICGRIEGSKESCYQRLFNTMRVYTKNTEELLPLCSKIKDQGYQSECRSLHLTP